MVAISLKYVTARRDKGGVRYYWQRKGHDLVRLFGDPGSSEFVAHVNQLNTIADQKQRTSSHTANSYPRGTMGWLIAQYRQSPEFLDTRETTKRTYGQLLDRLQVDYGRLPYKTLTRTAVLALRDKHKEKRHFANALLRQLRILLNFAVDRAWIASNPASRPRQLTVQSRDQTWDHASRTSFCAKAEEVDPPLLVAFMLGLYTVQRQSDCLAMRWNQFDGEYLAITQSKTRKNLRLPVHSELRKFLEQQKRNSPFIIEGSRHRPLTTNQFQMRWRKIAKLAGLTGLQFRDLRRTGMTEMAESGASIAQIASVSGHSIDSSARIIETYVPRGTELARAAIEKWQNAK